jgi:hypothetical protein
MSDPTSRSRGKTQRLPPDDLPEEQAEPRAGAQPGARRTERLPQGGEEWSQREPVNPGWRSERATGRKAARRGTLPSSPQEFQLWLQAGGWRYLAGIAALLVVLLIAVLAFSRNDQREAGLPQVGQEQPAVSEPVLGGAPAADTLPSVTPEPTVPPAPSFFVVTGTAGQGLFLRPQPSTEGAPLTTLPDGTRVEQIGQDVPGPDRVWRQVRAPDGQTGYVAVDFLTPAP